MIKATPQPPAPSGRKEIEALEAKLETYKNSLSEIYDQYDQKLEELSLVRRMGEALKAPLDLEHLSAALLAVVAEEISVDRVSLLLSQPASPAAGASLRLQAAYWAAEEAFRYFTEAEARAWPWPAQTQAPGGRPLALKLAQAGQDPLSFLKPGSGRPGPGDHSPRALLFLPLIARDQPVGLLVLSRPLNRPFSPDEERLLAIMGDQAATAVANVRLFDDLNQANLRLSRSESQARRISLYLENLLEAANDVIFTLGARGEITYVNQRVAQWGWAKEDLSGRRLRDLLNPPPPEALWPPGEPPPAGRMLEATLLTARDQPREILLSTSVVSAPEALHNQEFAGPASPGGPSWLVMASDLTERKQLERQLFHSEKLASIGLLAAGVAHEIGNPLSAISGYSQLLISEGLNNDSAKEYLLAIEEQTGRIQKILKELLNYSRPAQGVEGRLDLGELVVRFMGMLTNQRAFSHMKVIYDFRPEDGPYEVNMDRDHLAQIVVIVAMNAAQALKAEAEGCNGTTAGEFRIGLAKKAGRVLLKLSDNGPGMSPEVSAKVFEPFFTTKSPGQGTGLGLAICQRLVDSYRGEITLETAPNRGASFLISLPAA